MDLKELRLKNGFTQKSLGKLIGSGTQQVHNWEAKRSPVPFKYVPKLAKALKVPVEKMETLVTQLKLNRWKRAAKTLHKYK